MIETPASLFWTEVKTKIKWQIMLYIQFGKKRKKICGLTYVIKISSTKFSYTKKKKRKHTALFFTTTTGILKEYTATSAITEIFHALSNCKTEKYSHKTYCWNREIVIENNVQAKICIILLRKFWCSCSATKTGYSQTLLYQHTSLNMTCISIPCLFGSLVGGVFHIFIWEDK